MSKNQQEDVFYWSSEMILKTFEYFMPDWMFAQIPEQFINQIREIETVITDSDLQLILAQIKESMDSRLENFPIFNNFWEIFDELEINPALPDILGIKGHVNHMAQAPIQPLLGTPGMVRSNREWVLNIAAVVFDHYSENNSDLPLCSKYTALFHAEELVDTLQSHEMIYFDNMKLSDALAIIQNNAIKLLKEETEKDKKDFTEEYGKELMNQFEETNFWLIPEYKFIMKAELESCPNKKFSMKQMYEFHLCDTFFDIFFTELGKAVPFITTKPRISTIIESKPALMKYKFPQKEKVFKNSLLMFAASDMKSLEGLEYRSNNWDSNIPSTLFSVQDGYKMVSNILGNRSLSNVVHMEFTDAGMYLPFVSPEQVICMEVFQAFNFLMAHFLSLDIMDENFNTPEVQECLMDTLRMLQPCIDYYTPVSFFEDVLPRIKKWNDITKQYRQIIYGPPATTTKNELISHLTQTMSGKMYPAFPNAYADYMDTNHIAPNFITFKLMSMFPTFPDAAIQLHQMNCCHILDGCCALDLVLDHKSKQGEKRCGK